MKASRIISVIVSILSATVLSPALAGEEPDYPGAFIHKSDSNVTRAQVVAELRNAKRSSASAGEDANYPASFESKTASGLTRAQVIAELRAAQRLGLMPVGERGAPQASIEQLRQIELAGRRAVEPVLVVEK